MVFWIFVILFVAGMIGCCCLWNDYDHNGLHIMSFGTAVISGIVALIMSIFVFDACVGIDGYTKKLQAHYDSMMYQYENDIYDNDNDFGKRELMVEITSWNESLAYKQEVQDDFWIGIFYPNIYDQFEFIELKGD